MPVKDDYTCMLILDEIIHTCGLCDTEKDKPMEKTRIRMGDITGFDDAELIELEVVAYAI